MSNYAGFVFFDWLFNLIFNLNTCSFRCFVLPFILLVHSSLFCCFLLWKLCTHATFLATFKRPWVLIVLIHVWNHQCIIWYWCSCGLVFSCIIKYTWFNFILGIIRWHLHVSWFIANCLIILIVTDLILLCFVKLIINVSGCSRGASEFLISLNLKLIAERIICTLLACSRHVVSQMIISTLTLRDLAHWLSSILVHHLLKVVRGIL